MEPFQNIASSATDLQYGIKFHKELEKLHMEICNRCNERWFNMAIFNGICKKCHTYDAKKEENEPFFFSAANELDFGPISPHLPELTMTEQMMISKIHVFTQIRQIRGAQYRYKGHCVSFARNIAKVCFFLFFL